MIKMMQRLYQVGVILQATNNTLPHYPGGDC